MTKLNKDIFAGSLAAGKLERLHLSNGLLADIPIEAFQVRLKSAFNNPLLDIGFCLERSFWPSIPPFSFNVCKPSREVTPPGYAVALCVGIGPTKTTWRATLRLRRDGSGIADINTSGPLTVPAASKWAPSAGRLSVYVIYGTRVRRLLAPAVH